jgi:heptosyltransferase-2
MGDMIIYLPYIHAITKKYGVPVSLLVKNNSRASDLLSDDESINKIILLERNSRSKKGLHDGIRGFFKLINEIKTEKFDKVFIFNSSLRYFLVSKLAGIKSISQYPLFRKKDNVVISAKIFAEQELNQIIPTQPILSLASEKIEKKKKNFSSSFKHICIGLSASGPTKRWDVNNYINLCEKLNNKISCKFYLAGGNNDQKLISKFLNSKIGEHCLSFDNLKIKETMPIIKNCDIYIGNDTGWLHISSALGLKCLALFMDSPVMAYGKYSKNISIVVPEGETEETTTHDTLGKDRISFEKVYRRSLELLS